MADGDKHGKHKLKLKGSLGKGAFGEIRKGLLDGDTVAVKTMAPGQPGMTPDSEVSAQMFFREAEMLRKCKHSYVDQPQLNSVTTTLRIATTGLLRYRRIIGFKALMHMPPTSKLSSGAAWALVMEYAKHGNLGQRVVQNMIHPGRKAYTNAQALGWALDVATALEYLHMLSPSVLHRDVKSANIMLTEDEEGVMVAKLSDFGLHVTADSSRPRALQASSLYGGVGIAGAAAHSLVKGGSSVPAVTVMAAPTPSNSGSSSRTPDSSGRTSSSSTNHRAAPAADQQQHGLSQPPAPAATAAAAADGHELYSEVHDSRGSRVYVEGAVSPDSASAAAAAAGGKQRMPARRNNSFKRAVHHPPGEALPRLTPNSSGVLFPAAATADLEAAADANARLFAHWRDGGGSGEGNVCSMVTEGTWATQGTAASCTDTAGSDCTDDTCGSIWEEVETVFNMTGRTGSCLYMAPEVYLAHKYNEKSDVFSFGVVLYELFARCLVVFTELPTNSSDPDIPQRYAAKVAGGYRPSRPKSMPDNMWGLITACWQQDPLMRPHMSEVVAVLTAALAGEGSRKTKDRKLPSRSTSSGAVGSIARTSPPLAAAAAAVIPVTEQQQQDKSANGRHSCEGRAHPAGVPQVSPTGHSPSSIHAPAPPSTGCGCVIC